MNTVQINCKMKEIYYSPTPIKERESDLKSRYEFWNSMNLYAMQNMSLLQMKMS